MLLDLRLLYIVFDIISVLPILLNVIVLIVVMITTVQDLKSRQRKQMAVDTSLPLRYYYFYPAQCYFEQLCDA